MSGLRKRSRLPRRGIANRDGAPVNSEDSETGDISWETRQYIYRLYNGYCAHCGKRVAIGGIHHKVFRSQGGTNDPSNLELVCDECHAEKHGIRALSMDI
jgi:5-methylcytosine-specific restriction endonuclease McrA